MSEGTVSSLSVFPSTAWTTDILRSSSTAFSKETSTMPAGWTSLPSASLNVMSIAATTSPPAVFSVSFTRGFASSSDSSLISATVPAGRMPAAACTLTMYLPTVCSAVNSGSFSTTTLRAVSSVSVYSQEEGSASISAPESVVILYSETLKPSGVSVMTSIFSPSVSSKARSVPSSFTIALST